MTDSFDPLTQESINALHGKIMDAFDQYQSGIMMLDEFLLAMGNLYISYPQTSLVGLIDPPTGLKYKSDAEVAAKYEQHCRDIEQPD